MKSWIDAASEGIRSLPPGRTLSATDIVGKVQPRVGEPKDSRLWGVALAEAEYTSDLIFTGEFSYFTDFLPLNPIYKTAGEEPMDFWSRLREGASESV